MSNKFSSPDFAQWLRGYMEDRRLNQQETAKHLGISQSLVSAYLKRKHVPNRRMLESIERILDPKPRQSMTQNMPRIPFSEADRFLCSPDPLFPRWLTHFKKRWRRTSDKTAMELAVRVLFAEKADEVFAWLDEG